MIGIRSGVVKHRKRLFLGPKQNRPEGGFVLVFKGLGLAKI